MVSVESPRDRLARVSVLVTKLALVGIIFGLSLNVLSCLFFRFMQNRGWHEEQALAGYNTNVLEREVMIVTANSREGRFRSILVNFPFRNAPWWVFFPVCFYMYLGKEGFPKFWAAVAVALSIFSFLVGYGYFGNEFLKMTNVLQTYVLFALALKFGLPKDSRIPRQMVYQILITVLGQVLLMTVKLYPLDLDWFVLLLFGVIYPIMRDVTRFMATKSAWYLSSEEGIAGSEGPEPHRAHAWLFVGWLQLFWSIYFRLQVANIADPTMALVIILWQAILEIVLRLTVKQRDSFLSRCWYSIKRGYGACARKSDSANETMRKTKVQPMVSAKFQKPKISMRLWNSILSMTPTSGTKLELEQASRKRDEGEKIFYSLVVLVEMMAEYTGISVSCLLIAYFSDHIIDSPYLWYTSQPLDSPQNLSPLFMNSLVQLVAETVVDVVCMFYEVQRDPESAWVFLTSSKSFLFLYAFVSLTGAHLASLIVIASDSYDACIDRDLCYCVGNGLVVAGVRDQYCKLLYANTTVPGVPDS